MYLHFLLAAFRDLLQRQFHFDTHVTAATHTLTASAATTASEETAYVAEVETGSFEDITEMREDIFHRHAASAETACTLHAGHAELVIALTFLRIRQHFISLSRFLEFLLCLLITGVLIRVILDGFLAVSLFYLFCCSGLLDPQHFIIISFLCHTLSPFSFLLSPFTFHLYRRRT